VFVNRRAAARYRGPGINYTGHERGSPGIYHFSFLKQFFMNKCFVVEIFLRSKNIRECVDKNSDPDVGLREIAVCYRISLVR